MVYTASKLLSIICLPPSPKNGSYCFANIRVHIYIDYHMIRPITFAIKLQSGPVEGNWAKKNIFGHVNIVGDVFFYRKCLNFV